MSTAITHVWNEHKLLPLWLEWHARWFDELIVLDCMSTDGSADIAAEFGATVVQTGLTQFGAKSIDEYVMRVEEHVRGWRIALNTTEFFIGDPIRATRQAFIPSVSLIDMGDEPKFDWSRQFWQQRQHGVHYQMMPQLRRSRLFTNRATVYDLGRHFTEVDADGYLIVHVANCLVDDHMMNRRLAIQSRIPDSDKQLNLGFQHHNHGRGLTQADVLAEQQEYRKVAINVYPDIEAALP